MAVQGPSNRGIWNGPTGRSHGEVDSGRSRRSDAPETTRRTGFDTADLFSTRGDRGGVDRSGSREGGRTSLFGGLRDALSGLVEKGVSFFKSLFSAASYTPKPILPPGGVRIQPPTDTATQPTDPRFP